MSDNLYQTPRSDVNQFHNEQVSLGEIKSCSIGTGSHWVGEAWRLFKLQPGAWIGLFIVYMIIMLVLSWIPLVNFLSGIITPLFTGGWMIAAMNCDRNASAKVDDLFAGFSKNSGALALVGVISIAMEFLIMLVLGVVLVSIVGMNEMMSMANSPEQISQLMPILTIFFLLFMALILPVVMMVWYAPVLVVQHNIGAWDAMVKSFFACLKNVLPLTYYSLIMLILLFAAMIPLMLGLLIVIPMIMISVYTSYKDIFLENA